MKASPALQLVMSPQSPSRESLVDEYYRLDGLVKAFAPTKTKYEKLRETILSWYPDEVLPPDADSIAPGTMCDLLIGPRQVERKPASMLAVFRKFGKGVAGREKFLAACSITIKALVTAFGQAEADELLVGEHTGSRKLVPVPKLGEAA